MLRLCAKHRSHPHPSSGSRSQVSPSLQAASFTQPASTDADTQIAGSGKDDSDTMTFFSDRRKGIIGGTGSAPAAEPDSPRLPPGILGGTGSAPAAEPDSPRLPPPSEYSGKVDARAAGTELQA